MDEITIQAEKQQIFSNLKQFIADIIGADIVEQLDISEKSTFTKDLEMDSIEIVSFAEKVKLTYGKDIDFTTWLSSMDLEQIVNLNLNDIIEYIINANHTSK